jgi:hypothetical protein
LKGPCGLFTGKEKARIAAGFFVLPTSAARPPDRLPAKPQSAALRAFLLDQAASFFIAAIFERRFSR